MCKRLRSRISSYLTYLRLWSFLRRRVTGRIKLRGILSEIRIHPSFRCDGDIWLGVYGERGRIEIMSGVSASGPLVVTAIDHIVVGQGALFGPNILITDHYHGNPRDAEHRRLTPSKRPLYGVGPIILGTDVQIGANAVILSPSEVGDGAIIGANAVVKGSVPRMTIFAGIGRTGGRSSERGKAISND